jgi:cation transport ATPase
VVVSASEFVPSDGEIIEGVASVDESAITGESAPVIREAGGDRSAVTGGTRVLSDQIRVKVTSNPGETFLDRMIALVEGRGAAEDAQRDRAEHPARRLDHHLPAGRGHLAALRNLLGLRRRRCSCWSRCWCA